MSLVIPMPESKGSTVQTQFRHNSCAELLDRINCAQTGNLFFAVSCVLDFVNDRGTGLALFVHSPACRLTTSLARNPFEYRQLLNYGGRLRFNEVCFDVPSLGPLLGIRSQGRFLSVATLSGTGRLADFHSH